MVLYIMFPFFGHILWSEHFLVSAQYFKRVSVLERLLFFSTISFKQVMSHASVGGVSCFSVIYLVHTSPVAV